MIRLTLCIFGISAIIGLTYEASLTSARLTDCQRRREREQRVTHNLSLGLLVPECDENGEYLSRQCFGQAVRGPPFCACYDRDFGQIKGPSRKIVACDCIRAHHEWERTRGRPRRSAPRCNTTSGEFDPVQCDDTKHWCVDTYTGEKKGIEMDGGCRTDLTAAPCARPGSHEGHVSAHGHASHQGTSTRHSGPHPGRPIRSSGSRHHDDNPGSNH